MSLAKQIGSVAKTALTNAGHMSMNTEIYARILDTTVAALHLEALAPGYKECIDREAECVNRVTKSASTAHLEAKDKERNKTLRLEPTEAINAFIDTVNQIFRKYKNLIAAKGGPTSPSKPDDKPYPTPDPTPEPENPGGDSESPDEI